MPQLFKFGSYWIYFWTNEGTPREPIHIHISEGRPVQHATKVWITSKGKCSLANNNSKIPEKTRKHVLVATSDGEVKLLLESEIEVAEVINLKSHVVNEIVEISTGF